MSTKKLRSGTDRSGKPKAAGLVEALESRLLFSVSAMDAAVPTVTIGDTSVGAGSHGQMIKVPVTLSEAATGKVKVSYATVSDTAVKGADYRAKKGTVTFKAGQTTKYIKVWVRRDVSGEVDAAFNVQLSNAKNATLDSSGGAHGRVAILNARDTDVVRPTMTVSDASANVAEAEVFTVSLSHASEQDVSVRYQTVAGSEVDGEFTPVDGILTIPAGETTGVISVGTNVGGLSSGQFTLKLTAPTNAVLANVTANGVIVAPPPVVVLPVVPTVSISNASVAKVDSGTSVMTFTVTLSQAATQDVSVDYATADATAVAGTDYEAASGTLDFTAGETSKTISVTVDGNSNIQLDKTLDVVLSGVTNGTIGTATGVGTIVNNDFPTLSVGTAAAGEVAGNVGSATLAYGVTLSHAAPFPVTVHYATSNGNAVAGTDYTATSGTLTFAPGETSKTVSVAVNGLSVAPTETVALNLSDATNGSISNAVGVGTIQYMTDGVVLDTTSDPMDFTDSTPGNLYTASFVTAASTSTVKSITVSGSGGNVVSVYTNGSNQPGSLVGTLTYAGGDTYTGDGIALNASSTYWIVVSAGSSGSLNLYMDIFGMPGAGKWYGPSSSVDTMGGKPIVQVTVEKAFAGPSISVSGTTLQEASGTSSSQTMTYTVALSSAMPFPVTVHYATSDGTAVAGTDYTVATGTLTFAPGQTSRTVGVSVAGGTITTAGTVNLDLSNATNGSIGTASATGIVFYGDDIADNLTASRDISVNANFSPAESFTTGTSYAQLTNVSVQVYQSNPGSTLTMSVYTNNSGAPGTLVGTLTAVTAYTPLTNQTAVFAGGGIVLSPNTTYWVEIHGNSNSFMIPLSQSHTGTGSGFTGAGWGSFGNVPLMRVMTAPVNALTIAPASVTENPSSPTTQTMTFTVTLASASSTPVTVNYATADGTATAGGDYTAASGVLTFAPGETTKTISVTVNGISGSSDETFDLNLSSPAGAVIATGTGVGTIAVPVVLSDNFGTNTNWSDYVTSTEMIATSFATGSAASTLSQVVLRTSENQPGGLVVMVYDDAGGQPGSLVGTLTSPSSYPTGTMAPTTFTASGITLDANATYWIVVTASGAYSIGVGTGSGAGSGYLNTDSLYTNNNGTSWGDDGDQMYMQVIA